MIADRRLASEWRVVLVVPAHNALPSTAQLDALIDTTLTRHISIVLPDTGQARDWAQGLVSDVELDVQCVLPAEIHDGGLWSQVLRCQKFSDELLIYVLAGSRVPIHWDARLVAAHQRSGEQAVVSPMGVRHPFLSAFTTASHTPGLIADAVDQWLNDYSDGRELPVPVVSPSCFLISTALAELLYVDSDELLAAAVRAVGGETVMSTQLYVDDSRAVPQVVVEQTPVAYREAFQEQSMLGGLRHALTELSSRGEIPGQLRGCLPVQLHVGHSWGGGLARWMEDYTVADNAHHHLILRSIGDLGGFGRSIGLYAGAQSPNPIRVWKFSEPVLSIHGGNLEYRAILGDIIAQYRVESIVVSSLIGHSLDLLRTGLPTTLVLHEFFPFCPALYATFDSPCRSCDAERLTQCMQHNPKNEFFKHEPVAHWLNIREAFLNLLLERKPTLVAPNQSVVDRYTELEPRLKSLPLHVVPHGLDPVLSRALSAVRSGRVDRVRDRLQLVMLGRLTREKGGELLLSMLPALRDIADIYLLGTGESGGAFEGVPGVEVVRSYSREELPGLLARVQPDVGLLLSTVPETFSYTLSELWAAGIPVVATRLGAFEERVEEGVTGWLADPVAGQLLARLQQLQVDRSVLRRASQALQQVLPASAADMVESYHQILPQSEGIPLQRYYRPRASYMNPYAMESAATAPQLIVDPQMSYRMALADFLQYSATKVGNSPKVNRSLGDYCARVLRYVARAMRA